MIPSYPLRPTNGGPFKPDRAKRGQWAYEPKVNGWRAIVHAPTGQMWNRQGRRLSIEKEFAAVLEAIRNAELPPEMEWLDCEAFERRHTLGKGSLVILDYIPPDKSTYCERRDNIRNRFHAQTWEIGYSEAAFLPNNRIMLLPSHREDEGLSEVWETLQTCNKLWNAEVFEGFVAKRIDSPYPRQLRSPNQESPHWVKHRWNF